jgi:transcription antitermination factor NusG
MGIEQHWAVARVFSKRAHRISQELAGLSVGTFQPTYVRRWFVDGRPSAKERPLMPGYMLVHTDDWGAIRDVEGVYGVLTNAGRASRVTDEEMTRLVLAHATGAHNDVQAGPEVRRPRRRRRPRPGRRFRMRQAIQPTKGV